MPLTNTDNQTSKCTGNDSGRTVSLEVLPSQGDGERRPAIRKSQMGKWRAAVLIGVHVLFAIHIIQWLIVGYTLSPVEPSESMFTLARGELNAGFIFFSLALLSTVIFGRYFCGWGCHVVALQDLCGWMMKKIGVRPKPFRSRLLMLAPLLLALYMFVWPTFKRDVLVPVLGSWWPQAVIWLGPTARFEGFTNHIMKTGFWDTFAGPVLAVPFLLVCGFLTVYLLGAKGFCTYGCPYGGFFAPLDKISPGKIKVDHDKCEGCGHCTAVCTSNVRVHEEIREYGMVVDPGCMKCMDCVSVCPNEALSFGFAKPTVAKGKPAHEAPKVKWDLSWPEEIVFAGIALAIFLSINGIYGVMPLLFGIGVTACSTFILWKAWRTLRDANVRIIGAQLKLRGRLRPAGVAFLAGTLALTAWLAHSGYVNFHRYRGALLENGLAAPRHVVMAGNTAQIPDAMRDRAAAALDSFERARSMRHGGVGLAETPGLDIRSAWLHLVVGELAEAEADLRSGLERQGLTDGLCMDLAQVIRLQGREDEAIAYLEGVLAEDPSLVQSRDMLTGLYIEKGRIDDAIALARGAVEREPESAAARVRYAAVLTQAERTEEAREATLAALERLETGDTQTRDRIATQLVRIGEANRAVEMYREALEARPKDASARARLGSLLLEMGRTDQALGELRMAAEQAPRDAGVQHDLAVALFISGRVDEAAGRLARAAALDPTEASSYYRTAAQMFEQVGRTNDAAFWRGRAVGGGAP
ncbi:MAG: tetratricopeptide repeat protein [Planctomycetota bacterium]|nr:tetratricopeptide repeat protein [Planctomycetota bacterium]